MTAATMVLPEPVKVSGKATVEMSPRSVKLPAPMEAMLALTASEMAPEKDPPAAGMLPTSAPPPPPAEPEPLSVSGSALL